MTKKILIASDHAGFNLKQKLLDEMSLNFFEDLGTKSNESVDYTDYANKLAQKVNSDESIQGVLICGTGVGMTIVANRYKNIRAGLAFKPEIAKLIREHNNANILVLPGRYMDVHEAKKCVENFITTNFLGGRHLRRIKKINK
tara:strand:+ start:157 stop:585 length:429 start_codon:yes stop_codon:yes gene_type:complete